MHPSDNLYKVYDYKMLNKARHDQMNLMLGTWKMYVSKANPMNQYHYFTSNGGTGFPSIYQTPSMTSGQNFPIPITTTTTDWCEPPPQIYEFLTPKGYRIKVLPDGNYEIVAPKGLDLNSHVKLHPKAQLLDPAGRVIEIDDDGNFTHEALINASERFIDLKNPSTKLRDSIAFQTFDKIAIPNEGTTLVLPNDVRVVVHANGKYTIEDGDRKIVYDFAPRAFNKFLNASDVLEDFIRYLGTLDVRQRHVMKLPLGLFINWLVIAAAEADGDPADDLKPNLTAGVDTLKAQPRCKWCKRFIRQAHADLGIVFCNGAHLDRYMARENVVALRDRRASRVPRIAPPSDSYFAPAA